MEALKETLSETFNDGESGGSVDISDLSIELEESGVDFTNGLKPRLRLKFKTLGLNFVNRMLSLWS